MNLQIMYQDVAVPSNLLWNLCGKLQNLKLEGNAAIKITSASLLIHFGLGYLMLIGLGTLKKGIQI